MSFLHKGFEVVTSQYSCIEEGVVIQHGITIGALKKTGDAPTIDRDCYIGATTMILGHITIENSVKVETGAVVLSDVRDGDTVGTPVRRITKE